MLLSATRAGSSLEFCGVDVEAEDGIEMVCCEKGLPLVMAESAAAEQLINMRRNLFGKTIIFKREMSMLDLGWLLGVAAQGPPKILHSFREVLTFSQEMEIRRLMHVMKHHAKI